jgi:hypothetical protein
MKQSKEQLAKVVSHKAYEEKLCDLRTVGRLKASLPFLQAVAFIGATLCDIINLNGKEDRFAVI